MALSASEFYEAGMALPPDVRKDLARRLLESVDDTDPTSVHDAWSAEISDRVDDILSGRVTTIPGEQVFAELAERRAARRG